MFWENDSIPIYYYWMQMRGLDSLNFFFFNFIFGQTSP